MLAPAGSHFYIILCTASQGLVIKMIFEKSISNLYPVNLSQVDNFIKYMYYCWF